MGGRIISAVLLCACSSEAPLQTFASPPPGTYRQAAITLTSTIDADIYYTLDGSEPTAASASGTSPLKITGLENGSYELKYFAKAKRGDTEPTQTANYTIDAAGPSAVRALRAEGNAGAAEAVLNWQPPPTSDGVSYVVARIQDIDRDALTDGVVYQPGDALTGGGQILYTGTTAAYKDTAMPVGGAAYAVWARHPGTSYSNAATVYAAVPQPAIEGRITINNNNGTIAITGTPAHVTLSLTQTNAQTGSFDVSVTHSLATSLAFPRLVITKLPEGNAANPDGIDQGRPFYLLHSGSLANANPSTARTIQITGVVSSMMTFDFSIASSPIATLGTTELQDALVAIDVGLSRNVTVGSSAPNGKLRPVAAELSKDGRYLWLAHGLDAAISKLDLQNMTAVETRHYGSENKHGFGAASFDNDGVYAVLVEGVHRRLLGMGQDDANDASGAQPQLTFVHLDKHTLEPGRTVALSPGFIDKGTRVRRFAIDPTGKLAAIPLISAHTDYDRDGNTDGPARAALLFVDLATMRVIGDPLELTGTLVPSELVFSADGETLYTNSTDYDGQAPRLGIIDVASRQIDFVSTTSRIRSLYRDDGGRIWLGRDNGLFWFNSENQSFMPIAAVTQKVMAIRGYRLLGNNKLIIVTPTQLRVLNSDTAAIENTVTVGVSRGNWLAHRP